MAVLIVTQSPGLQQLNACTQEKTGALVPFFARIRIWMLSKTLDVGTHFLGPPVLPVSQTCKGADGQQASCEARRAHLSSYSISVPYQF